MAKRATTTKKDTVAKAKIAKLLEGTNLGGKEEDIDVLDEKIKKEGTEWLQETIDGLTKENETLQADLTKAMKIVNGKESSSSDNSGDIEKGVRKLFKDLDDALQGRNKERRKYPDADLKILLGKFLREFPFLMKR